MKFMFFNLMAIVAILYLVAIDGKPTNSLPEFLTSTSSKEATRKRAELAKRARQKLENFKAMIEPSKTDVKKTPEAVATKVKSSQKITPTVTPKVTTKSTVTPKVTTKSTAKPQPVKVATRPVHIVPPISEVKSLPRARLKPVTKPTPNLMSSIVEQPQKQKFMSRAERRRELNRLAHDMEMMFVDKISD